MWPETPRNKNPAAAQNTRLLSRPDLPLFYTAPRGTAFLTRATIGALGAV